METKSRAKVAAGLAYWTIQERKTYAEWLRLKHKNASTLPGRKRSLAYKAWNHAHQMRVRRSIELRKLDVTSWKINDASANAIASREGEIPYAYNDSQGHATAWIGHLIRLGSVRQSDYTKWGSPQHHFPNHQKIIDYFRDVDLAPYEKVVDDVARARVKNGHAAMTPGERGACVSLTFNIGTGGFSKSTVARRIKSGASKLSVADAFMLWDKPSEIIGRRKTERDQYLKG